MFSCTKPNKQLNTLQWHHNGSDSVSNHQPRECLLNCLVRCRSKKTSKLRVTGLCAGIHRRPVNSPHKGPVTQKMFPFVDAIMRQYTVMWNHALDTLRDVELRPQRTYPWVQKQWRVWLYLLRTTQMPIIFTVHSTNTYDTFQGTSNLTPLHRETMENILINHRK